MEGKCKIRKRGGSSSSSSSLARRYRLKRAILVGRKAGSTTPVPSWKPQRTGSSSPHPNEVGGKEFPVSARKLGATLWEINEVARDEEEEVVDDGGSCEEHLTGSPGQLVPLRANDPSQSPVTESKKDHRRRGCNHSRRASDNLQSRDRTQVTGHDLMEVESSCHGGKSHGRDAKKTCLKEVSDCLLASKELVKVLCRIRGLAKRTAPTLSLVSALCVELDRAFVQVERLMNEEWSRRGEVEEFLMKRFAEEKARWKCKERERVTNVGRRMAEEVEAERKLRRQTERLNQKLSEELTGTKAALYRMSKELQSERRTKEILQQVCDELSRGIGEDRAQVEELKRESAKVIEEVEKEREMLQLADVLREERVQMKLSEAKYHFEEKNAVVEKLKDELESYLGNKMNKDGNKDDSSKLEKIKELQAYLRTHDSETTENANVEENGVDAGDDSGNSDLQSIELNMDNNTRSYRWNFVNEEYDRDDEDEPRRSSVDRMFKGRKSLSDKINWESISLNRAAHDDAVAVAVANPEADSKNQGNLNGFDGRRLIDFFSRAKMKNKEENPKKNRTVNPTSAVGVASPVQKWSRSLPHDDRGKESGKGSPRQEAEAIQD